MLIEGLQKLTLLDYPRHVACTVFAHGCNLRCPFCHNAGLVIRKPENIITNDELSAFFEKRKGILDGICLTGGEPLAQADSVEFVRFLKKSGLKIKLDTNGFYPERLEQIIKEGLVDYIATDIKSSKENYAKAVGLESPDISKIEKSVGLIMDSGIEYEFRTTAVKGLHTEEDFSGIAKWISGAKRYYIQKFIDSGDLISQGYDSFSDAEMANLLNIIKEYVPTAEIRGM